MASYDLITHREIQSKTRLSTVIYKKLSPLFKPKGKAIPTGSFLWASNFDNKIMTGGVIEMKIYNNPAMDGEDYFDRLCIGALQKAYPNLTEVNTNGDLEIQFEDTVIVGGKEKPISKIRFKSSNKKPPSKQASKGEDSAATKTYSSGQLTVMRENVSMYFIGLALEEGLVFDHWVGTGATKNVCDHPKIRKNALALMPNIETGKKAWEEQYSAIEGARLMVAVINQGGWKRTGWWYDRDGFVNQPFSQPSLILRNYRANGIGFMDYISAVVGKYGFSQKDAWNPADIWLTRGSERKIRKEIDTILKNAEDACPDNDCIMGKLNDVMKEMFISGDIVGVSLKKVAKPKKGAFWKIYNVDPPKFSAGERTASGESVALERMMVVPPTYDYKIDKMECKLNFSGNEKSGTMATQELKIVLAQKKKSDVYPSGKLLFDFTVKTTAGVSKYANLKYEPTYIPRAAAKLGKAPVGDVKKILEHYKIWSLTPVVGKHCQDNRKYPKTIEQFTENAKLYAKMWKSCAKEAGVSDGILTNIKSQKEFIEVFEKQYTANPKFGQTKLMQINFGSAIFTKTKSVREKIMNQMLMQAEKLGAKYGPFGKIY
jgi:hypothetical protein